MRPHRPFAFALSFLATLLFVLPPAALAGRLGTPYRGPAELSGGSGGDDTDAGTTTGDTSGDGSGGGGEGGGGSDPGAPAPTPTTGTEGVGKGSSVDGSILWQWWWEHNKDRFLARATERGRVNAGSAYYWFGAGAKYPPRDITGVSEAVRGGVIFQTLKERLSDKPEVRAEAYIALGRLRFVPAAEADRKEGEPDNMIVRTLMAGLEKETDEMVRQSAALAFGICADPAGCDHLLRTFDALQPADKPYAAIAFGLARHLPAIGLLLENLPGPGPVQPTDLQVAAIHALGLYGPDAVEEMNRDGRAGIDRLSKLAKSRQAKEPVVIQAVASLGRLQQDQETVRTRAGDRGVNIEWTSILALANYSASEDEAGKAAKELMKRAGKGKGQSKNYSLLALGDLASRLDPNSGVRTGILKFLQGKEGLDRKGDNYIRSCSAVALGLARDGTAVDGIAQLLTDTTADHYVAAAACVGLGLLRSTEHADTMVQELLQKQKKNAEAQAYAVVGLALMGDTTRLDAIRKYAAENKQRETKRQIPLALGILGDRQLNHVLAGYFAKPWKKQDQFEASAAAYGLSWIRDEGSVTELVKLCKDNDPGVRAHATVALGYIGSPDRVNALTRCYENISHANAFGGFEVLREISRIL